MNTFFIIMLTLVMFWVQNTILAFALDWRKEKEIYLDDYLKTRGITRADRKDDKI